MDLVYNNQPHNQSQIVAIKFIPHIIGRTLKFQDAVKCKLRDIKHFQSNFNIT